MGLLKGLNNGINFENELARCQKQWATDAAGEEAAHQAELKAEEDKGAADNAQEEEARRICRFDLTVDGRKVTATFNPDGFWAATFESGWTVGEFWPSLDSSRTIERNIVRAIESEL